METTTRRALCKSDLTVREGCLLPEQNSASAMLCQKHYPFSAAVDSSGNSSRTENSKDKELSSGFFSVGRRRDVCLSTAGGGGNCKLSNSATYNVWSGWIKCVSPCLGRDYLYGSFALPGSTWACLN